MKFLDQKQIKEVASFLTTTSVAWFSAGIIAPLFSTPSSPEIFWLSFALGSTMTLIFLILSVIMIKE